MMRLLVLAGFTTAVSVGYALAAIAIPALAHVLIVPCVGVLLLAHFTVTYCYRRKARRR